MPNKTTRPRSPRHNGAGRKTTPGKYERGAIDRSTRAAQRVTFGEGPAAATLDGPILERGAIAFPSSGGGGQGEGGTWSLQPLALSHQSLPKCPRCGAFIPLTSVTCDTCPIPQPL
jgi:hypothetical protein